MCTNCAALEKRFFHVYLQVHSTESKELCVCIYIVFLIFLSEYKCLVMGFMEEESVLRWEQDTPPGG